MVSSPVLTKNGQIFGALPPPTERRWFEGIVREEIVQSVHLTQSSPHSHQNRDGENWLNNLSSMFTRVAGIFTEDLIGIGGSSRQISRTAPPRSTRPGLNRANTSANRRPPYLVPTEHFSPTPVTATVTSVKANSVAGVMPGRGKAAKREPLGTPFLSPSLNARDNDPLAAFWQDNMNAEGADAEESMDDSDTDPPNLEAILSTYLKKNAGPTDPRDTPSTSESD
ncbi:hypothetical protein FS837_001468 [Tulasnella sp. UAMH 9824]|nr:hypothetical protein FS837_001468 [Tulasnella sp. UAMH 9824]